MSNLKITWHASMGKERQYEFQCLKPVYDCLRQSFKSANKNDTNQTVII